MHDAMFTRAEAAYLEPPEPADIIPGMPEPATTAPPCPECGAPTGHPCAAYCTSRA